MTDTTPPALRTLAAKVRRGSVRLRFKLGEDAKVTVVAPKRGNGKKLRRTTRLRSGTRTIILTLKRGRYTIAASARDAAGNTSPTIRRTVRVR